MNKDLQIIWIDDSTERNTDATNLEDAINIEVDFRNVNKVDIDKVLSDLVKSQEPDLIIMDHSLDKAYSSVMKMGSTAAIFIHDSWPSCPIISVTAVDSKDIDTHHKSAYEAIIQSHKISENYHWIKSIVECFSELKKNNANSIRGILKFLKAPDIDMEKIIKVLPTELKESPNDPGLILDIFKWCQSILFDRPGFLYNEIWASTFLGVNLAGFQTIKKKFECAKYNGAFLNPNKPLWWKSAILERLGELSDESGLPWRIGRQLVKSDDEYISFCYSSNEEYPETVALEDTTPNAEWRPMKLKYTEPHPNFEEMLFFEEIRLMLPGR